MPSTSTSGDAAPPHGRLTASEVGALAGVSGTTIGQWARWGYVRSSQASGEPRVYSAEDAAEAVIVAELLRRGVSHAGVRDLLAHLAHVGSWPLSHARLATTAPGRPPAVAVFEEAQWLVLGPRGWQAIADGIEVEEMRMRFRRGR